MSNAIVFTFGGDNSPLARTLDQTQAMVLSSVQQTAAKLGGIASSLNGALQAAVLGVGVKGLLDFAGTVSDLSASVNLNTDTFQRWSFALEQSGGKQEDLVKSMGVLISKMEDAKGGNQGAIDSFARLGITLSDLQRSSPQDLFLRIADALKSSGADGATTAGVMDLLGTKIAMKVIPALKDGSAAFLTLGQDAKIASAEAIKAADDLGDRFAGLANTAKTSALQGLFNWADLFSTQKEFVQAADGQMSGFAANIAAAARTITTALGLRGFEGAPQISGSPDMDAARAEQQGRLKPKAPAGVAEVFSFGPSFSEMGASTPEEQAMLAQRAKTMQEIAGIASRIAEINLEASRDGMDAAQLISSLSRERAAIAAQALRYERDIFGLHQKEGAELRLQEASITRRIAALQRSLAVTANATATGEQFGPGPMEIAAARAGRSVVQKMEAGTTGYGALAGFASFGGAGALQPSGPIQGSGGLSGGAYGLVRKGDAGRRREEAEKAAQAAEEKAKSDAESKDKLGKDGVLNEISEAQKKMLEIWEAR